MRLEGFPSWGQWLGFLAAVFVASFVINSITRRIPQLAAFQMGV